MKLQHRIVLDLDMIAGFVIGALLLMIAIVILFGKQVGIRIITQLPADQAFGPYEALTLVFSEPVDSSLAVPRFSIQPAVKGKFEWSDAKTLRFLPVQPYQPDTVYTLTFSSGLLTKNGEALKKTKSWKFKIRQPLIVYLGFNRDQGRLWAVEKDSGKTMPLTQDTFKVLNFDASRNGEFIIFSAFNDQRGLDLWQINRTGGKAVLVLQCGVDRCSSPAIAPDNRHIAYVREAAGPTPDIPYGAPRIRVLDMQNKQDVALFEDQQIIGIEPAWSPDGTRLASFDGSKQEFRLLDLASSSQATIPSQLGNSIAWSADGSTFVYTDLVTNEFGTHSRIREAKLDTNEIMTLFGDADERDYRYNSLAFSPAADLLVIGLQPNDKDPSEALWLIHLATLDGQSIADQPGYVYDSPAWDLWGSAVIFQQFKLKGGYTPEIGLWTPDMQQPRVLAEGTLPEWLP